MKFPWRSPSTSTPTSPTAPTSPNKSSGHKRSFSGNILQKFNFLRSVGSDDGRPPSRDKEPQVPKSPKSAKSRKSIDDDSPITSPTSPIAESFKTFALRPVKARQRKGSLRKTALLGGKRIMSEGRERKNSLSAKSPLSKSSAQQPSQHQEPTSIPYAAFGGEYNAPVLLNGPSQVPQQLPMRQFSNDGSITTSSSDSGRFEPAPVTASRLSLVTEHKATLQTAGSSLNDLGSPLDIKSPTSQTSYASTTDDDDVLTFDRPANGFPAQSNILLPKPNTSAATSYFPSSPLEGSLPARKTSSSKHERSPLSHAISSSSLYPEMVEPHDYTETEYWGWIILFATWLTFTIGMGSCLDIWSWAWDVGETPYAPPELEDDATLPIVGYYPALMVLTGVVAWCWITVAWLGMKYFRHAKIEV
ncbi:hypothetical protein LTR65_010672 [Meristemomyces frigidus]